MTGQKKADRIATQLNDQIQDFVMTQPPTIEALSGIIAALSSCLVELAIPAFGKEKGLELISNTINQAAIEYEEE